MIPFALGMPGLPEMLVILVIVLLLFGAGRLPSVFRSLGEGLKSFRDAQREEPTDVGSDRPKISKDPVSEAHEVKEKAER